MAFWHLVTMTTRHGVTWYLQKVLKQLIATGDSVAPSDIDKAVEQIINQNEEAYKDVFYQLTARQRDLLVAVSPGRKAKKITGSAFTNAIIWLLPAVCRSLLKPLQKSNCLRINMAFTKYMIS